MKNKQISQLTLCDSYNHSQIIPIANARQIFDKIVKVYVSREDIYNHSKTPREFQAYQNIDSETLLIVVSIRSDWWTPWKGMVTEDVYFYREPFAQ
ncbi:hypothetical protein BVG16_05825 [Paenibacillus selenitireducens]|uniref:Uncharacterized protein n=1 Tax=Paenibacillus selenitireducens TaxID=1324314 RepID=A0A1T2XKA2_9BACL|nr:hypothetical protein [Paenibacillus selenitireducens]OPA80255.1 hypothetical protein BVG16_05825 [Paenibacillus selenitireducens]